MFGFLIPVSIVIGLFIPRAWHYKALVLEEYNTTRVIVSLSKMLHSSHRVTLSSLDPERGVGLGETEITDPAEQKALLSALIEGIKKNDGSAFACFIPRHSLHIDEGTRSVDLLICFECEKILPEGLNVDYTVLVSRAPEPVFDAALKRHGVPKPQH